MSECPTCGDSFETSHGMKVHHTLSHGESLVKVECECSYCGDSFKRFKSKVEGVDTLYCSHECKYEDGRVSLTCTVCGEETERLKYRADRYSRHFCSRECYLELKREGGENAPGWIDGRFSDPDYHADYNKKWRENREAAIERDGHECQICGMTSEGSVARYGRDLDVHHIQPVSTFESPDDAHELENLITLCISCHSRWEGIPLVPEGLA